MHTVVELGLQMTVKMRYDLSEVVNNSISEWEYYFEEDTPEEETDTPDKTVGSFENEDWSTKHPNLENEALKTRKRTPLNLENKAP